MIPVNSSLARRAHEEANVADSELNEGGETISGRECPWVDSSLSSFSPVW